MELRKAATNSEIQARDPVTLLALDALPDGWQWLVSIGDADKFIATRGMGWTCSERVEHLLKQSRQAGTQYKDPKTGQVMKHYWLAGFEPPEADTQPHAETAQTVVGAAPSNATVWVSIAQSRAREMIAEQKSRDLYPSQQNLGDLIAGEFRTAGIFGVGGKPLTGAYIKRHALKGISSEQGKQLSTSIRKGK